MPFEILTGRIYEKVKGDFPEVEQLPAAKIPLDVSPPMVRYRFRQAADEWPVLQIGHGVATLNFTDSYRWDAFLPRAESFFSTLEDVRETAGQSVPKYDRVQLRYINAIPLAPYEEGPVELLKSKLLTTVELPESFSTDDRLAGAPDAFQLSLNVPTRRPVGTGVLRFATGTKDDEPALVWEFNLITSGDDCPESQDEFSAWLGEAHTTIENWFFALLDDELLQSFKEEG